jgi:hypothetical protein
MKKRDSFRTIFCPLLSMADAIYVAKKQILYVFLLVHFDGVRTFLGLSDSKPIRRHNAL